MSALTSLAWQDCANADALADAVAARVEQALARALAERATASLVVSGGSTPRLYFPRIAACALDWRRVAVTLADDRWVDAADDASNEKLVRDFLLQGPAAGARFVGLKTAAATPHAGAGAAAAGLAALAHPYDAVILGMGDDGHIASLFPTAPELGAGLDPASTTRCIGVTQPAYARPPVARISMTLAELLDARLVVLAIQGESKRAALEAALAHGDAMRAPVAALAARAGDRLEILWAP